MYCPRKLSARAHTEQGVLEVATQPGRQFSSLIEKYHLPLLIFYEANNCNRYKQVHTGGCPTNFDQSPVTIHP